MKIKPKEGLSREELTGDHIVGEACKKGCCPFKGEVKYES